MITLSNITKTYGTLTVLHDISLTVGEGELMAIVGPSGAGKTTLLQIAGSLDRPDSGTVSYDGTDLTSLPDRKLSEFRNR
ncbi:MAG: ATP-binding cassette domain-containing protein, partial [Muribaculaceae bacterium]|nr:ATP-binding cassette domain-containing protein [Muribaculaceae bacterium]